MASVSCRCGSVTIRFPSKSPRVTTECCCDHCLARVRFLEGKGGPKIPTDHEGDPRPLLASKWDNRFQVVRGRDKLFVYKMNPGTMVVNVASSCCHTFMLGRHPGYDANCVTTSDDFPVYDVETELIAPTSRWFANQWDPERLARFDPLPALWVVADDDMALTGVEGWEAVYEAQTASMERDIPQGATGETFDDLVHSLGDNVLIASEENQWKECSSSRE